MNKVILSGNVASDIDVRTLPNGKFVGTFNLACDRGFKSDSGTDFFRVTVWNGAATNFEKYINKGDMVEVIGHLRTGKFDKAYDCGHTHTVYPTEIHADEIEYGPRAQRHRETAGAGNGSKRR